jgi:IS30 family transposase
VTDHTRFGDQTVDLVIGAGQKQTLVTLNERVSCDPMIAGVQIKKAQIEYAARITFLKPYA